MNRIWAALLFIIVAATASAQDIKYIKFKQENTFHPKSFHLISVIDDRPDTTTIGTARFGLQGRKMQVNFRTGLASALAGYLNAGQIQDEKTIPVSLHIAKVEVSESLPHGFIEQADVALTLAFYQGNRKLVEYSGSGYQQARFDASGLIEKLIRDRVDNCLIEFDKWWQQNQSAAGGNPDVKVVATVLHATNDADLIPYTHQRPLTLSDFQGPVDDINPAAAATFSGMSVTYQAEGEGNRVTVRVNITPYFDRTRSWCRSNARDTKTLAHEQMHFDITAIKACELATAIQKGSYTENYSKEIDNIRKQYERDWQDQQDQYDRETRHGTIKNQQLQWEQKIKEQVAVSSCY